MRSPLVTALFAAAMAAQQGAVPTEVHWHGDLAAAREAAQTQHKPLLVLFRCER